MAVLEDRLKHEETRRTELEEKVEVVKMETEENVAKLEEKLEQKMNERLEEKMKEMVRAVEGRKREERTNEFGGGDIVEDMGVDDDRGVDTGVPTVDGACKEGVDGGMLALEVGVRVAGIEEQLKDEESARRGLEAKLEV